MLGRYTTVGRSQRAVGGAGVLTTLLYLHSAPNTVVFTLGPLHHICLLLIRNERTSNVWQVARHLEELGIELKPIFEII